MKISFTLSTNGIAAMINPTIPAHIIPSIQLRGLNPKTLFESSTLSGIWNSYNLSSFKFLPPCIITFKYIITIIEATMVRIYIPAPAVIPPVIDQNR